MLKQHAFPRIFILLIERQYLVSIGGFIRQAFHKSVQREEDCGQSGVGFTGSKLFQCSTVFGPEVILIAFAGLFQYLF